MKTCCALIGVASVLTAPSLFASIIGTGTTTVTAPGYPPDIHGPFTAATTEATGPALGTFETFCIAYNVDFHPGTTYSYSVDTTVYPIAIAPDTRDAFVDLGTAYLFSQYHQGLIGDGSANDSVNDAIQDAIWYLQGVGGVNNAWVAYAYAGVGGATLANTDANGAYGVYAMNLFTTDANGGVTYAQAQLAIVPEASTVIAGALLLLPLGVSAIRIVRKNRVV